MGQTLKNHWGFFITSDATVSVIYSLDTQDQIPRLFKHSHQADLLTLKILS